MRSVLFVCLSNTCRSPAGEVLLKYYHALTYPHMGLFVDSCGVGDWCLGEPPDKRMCQAAAERGIQLSGCARQVTRGDFDCFDLLLAADRKILASLLASAPDGYKHKIHFMTFHSSRFRDQEVPDPYFGDQAGFEHTLDILEDSCKGLLDNLFG